MEELKNISIIFISIFFESLPFLLLGSFISSIIEIYVSTDKLVKLMPKNKFLGSIVGAFLGFFLPACDCAVIPITKRLLKKNIPINVVITFMLASPIINPVVLLSTYNAFYKSNPNIFWFRLLFGLIISIIIGTIIGIMFNKKEVIRNRLIDEDDDCHCHCHCHSHKQNKLVSVFKHTSTDLYEVVKFLILGALIASLIQVLVPRSILMIFNNNKVLSIIVLMIFAYLISLCSTSDSFVGKSLLSIFNEEAVLAYLLLGPMIDIKNTIVLLGNYKKQFVNTLIALIFIVIFIFSVSLVVIL